MAVLLGLFFAPVGRRRPTPPESPAVLSAQFAAAPAPTAAAPAGALAVTGQNLDLMAAMGVVLLAVGSVCATLGRQVAVRPSNGHEQRERLGGPSVVSVR